MFRARLGFIPLLPVLLVVFIAAPAMGMFAGRACMQGTGDLTTRIARLEDEISFRRRALRDALEKATTIQEIRQAQGVLGVHSPVRYPELRGRTLSDLTRELDGLHAQLEIVLPPEAPSTRPPVDTWLLANYPVDVEGFLFSVSLGELNAVRLAAAQQQQAFMARRKTPVDSRLGLVPDCSITGAVRYALGGHRRVAVSVVGAP